VGWTHREGVVASAVERLRSPVTGAKRRGAFGDAICAKTGRSDGTEGGRTRGMLWLLTSKQRRNLGAVGDWLSMRQLKGGGGHDKRPWGSRRRASRWRVGPGRDIDVTRARHGCRGGRREGGGSDR
jgi:hypothetical protein